MISGRSVFSNIPPVTKGIIVINFIIWFAMMLSSRLDYILTNYCALHFYKASDFNVAQIFTYMFMHSTRDFTHIFFNMFTLFMFGVTLERVLRSDRFLFYYISCGIGAALVQEVVWGLTWKDILIPALANRNGIDFATMGQALNEAIAMGKELPFLNGLLTVGASGAIYGILLAFGMIFPNMPLYIMFIPIPIKAKWMVTGYGVIELLIGLSNASDGVAHFAHLGGMLFGFIMILYWKKKGLFNGGY